MNAIPQRKKPPHDVTVMNRWLTQVAADSGVAAGRLRRSIGFMVLAGMLGQARHADGSSPLFLVKGGVAMELRAGGGARATKDFDTALCGTISEVAEHLDPALRAGYQDFTATRTELVAVGDTGAVRCDAKIAYRGKSFITVQLEVAEAEAEMGTDVDFVTALSLDHIGITGPDVVACVAVRWQIAQKLHACTQIFPVGENHRFRDLLDLQLLGALVPNDEWIAVREACAAIFRGRDTHSWPPIVTVYPSWRDGYPALANEIGHQVIDADQAAALVHELISHIDQAIE
jgi:hypothetical protein